MRPIPSIPAIVAAAVLLAPTPGLAQAPRAEQDAGRADREKREVETAQRARRQQLTGFARQLRPFYRYELMHVRAACGLSREELRAIRPDLEAAYHRAIVAIDAAWRRAAPSPGDQDPDYQQAIREAVHSVVEGHVDRSKWADLQADIRAREAARKEAGVVMFVALIDRELLLTARQRREIAGWLADHWDDRWCDAVETASTGPFRRPALPEDFVSFLSDAQRSTWRDRPRLDGRLWGVGIDHGGGAAMERELGAVEVIIDPFDRLELIGPAPRALNRLRIPVAPGVMPHVVRARAVLIQPAPPAPRIDGPDEDEDPAERLERQRLNRLKLLEERYQVLLVSRVLRAEEDAFRLLIEAALVRRVDYLGRAAGLNEAKRRKLRVAGHGDIKRFFDRLAEIRSRIIENVESGRKPWLPAEFQSLVAERDTLTTAEGPIFTRTMAHTLDDAPRAALVRDARDRLSYRFRADIRWTTVILARSLGLLDARRRRLESLLLERAVPPKKFDAFDDRIVMYQASRIPEEEIRPLFDDVQWGVMRQELAAAHRLEPYLKRGGFVDLDAGEVPNDLAFPIQLLAPPEIRRPLP